MATVMTGVHATPKKDLVHPDGTVMAKAGQVLVGELLIIPHPAGADSLVESAFCWPCTEKGVNCMLTPGTFELVA